MSSCRNRRDERVKKLFFMMLFISMTGAVFGRAPALYPGIGETVLRGGRGQGSFMIFNTVEETKRYRISVRDIDNMGESSLLGKHLRVFPTYLELEPGTNKTVRYLIRNFPQEGIEEGEYRASISIEEMDSNLEEKYKSREDTRGISTVINYRFNINMAIYGYVGKIYEKVDVETERDGSLIRGRVKNKGNYSYEIFYEFYDSRSEIIKRVSLPKLMDGDSVEFSANIPEGAYSFKIKGGKERNVLYELHI